MKRPAAPVLSRGEPRAAPQGEAHPLLAALWMTGAVISFTSMAVAGRFTSVELDTFELMMYRSFLGVVIVVGAAFAAGTWRQINLRRVHLHLLRNIFHFAGQNLWFLGISLIPLAQLVALEFTTPLWVILLAPILLGERLTRIKVLAAALGFTGILVVARPDFGAIDIGIAAAASCAIGFAGAMLFTKMLTRTESITCILFYLVSMQSLFGVVTAGYDGDVAVPSAAVLPWIAVIAVGGLVAHFSITKALTLAPASLVGPMDFARLPVVAVVGMIVFAEPLDLLVLAGAVLIFAGNYLNIWSQTRRVSGAAAS